jgi:hypothetical protein
MKLKILYILLLITSQFIVGQNRIITGRVLTEELIPIPKLQIQTIDTLLLAETDFEGRFSITVTKETEKLLLSWIGMEWTTIQLLNDCDNLEIITMTHVIYDFIPNRKVDKLRLKRFKMLPKLRKKALEKGLFVNEKLCYKQDFVASKPEFDRIKKSRIK